MALTGGYRYEGVQAGIAAAAASVAAVTAYQGPSRGGTRIAMRGGCRCEQADGSNEAHARADAAPTVFQALPNSSPAYLGLQLQCPSGLQVPHKAAADESAPGEARHISYQSVPRPLQGKLRRPLG